MTSYALSGDILQGVSALTVLLYTVLVLNFAEPGSKIFDEQWVKDGFCVINKDVPFFNSHDLCLYADMILVTVGFGIYQKLNGSCPEMKLSDDLMKFTLLGHLGHGSAHGFMSYMLYRSGDINPDDLSSNVWERLIQIEAWQIILSLCVLFMFWCGLLKGAMPHHSNRTIVMLSFPAVLGQLFVKEVFGFGYVQAVMSAAFSFTQLGLPGDQKNFAYLAMSIAFFVVSHVPWIECLACQSIASKLGGHLIFDVSIPICLGSGYVASWYHFNKDESVAKKKTL